MHIKLMLPTLRHFNITAAIVSLLKGSRVNATKLESTIYNYILMFW